MSPIPTTQKAIVAVKYGAPSDVIQYIDDHPVPQPKSNEILIKVSHSSVNPVDWKILKGKLSMVIKLKHPYVIGSDVSGEVVGIGSACQRLRIGDSVYTDIGADTQSAYQQYVSVPEQQCSIMPNNLSYADAAGIPLATLTSYQALKRKCNLQPGQSVLILGASGGTGTAAVQLAKCFGASNIVAVCSSKNVEFVKQLGANEVIAYDEKKWYEVLQPDTFDCVYDCIGGEGVWDSAQRVLKKNGTFTTIAGDKQGNPDKGMFG